MNEALNPCPFCGSLDIAIAFNIAMYYWVQCNNCYIRTGFGTKKEVIKIWNTRAYEEANNGK